MSQLNSKHDLNGPRKTKGTGTTWGWEDDSRPNIFFNQCGIRLWGNTYTMHWLTWLIIISSVSDSLEISRTF